mgnify:CR=1 FL=1|jgi:hypothetical protein
MAIINPKAGTMVNATTVHVQLREVHPSILYAFGVARDVCICCLMDKLLSVGFKRLIIMYIVIVYRTVTHTLKLRGLGPVNSSVDVASRFNGDPISEGAAWRGASVVLLERRL